MARALPGSIRETGKTRQKRSASIRQETLPGPTLSRDIIRHWSADQFTRALQSARRLEQWPLLTRLFKQRHEDLPIKFDKAYELYLLAEARQGNAKLFQDLALAVADTPQRYCARMVTAVLHGLVLCGQVATAIDTAQELMQHDRNKLSCSSFNVLLKGARLGSVDGRLLDRVEAMRSEARAEKDAITFNTLISAHLKLGNEEAAHIELAECLKLGLATTSTYNTLIHHAIDSGRQDDARDWIGRMRAGQISRDIKTYLPFLVDACKRHDWAAFATTMDSLEQEKIPLDTSVLNVLSHAALRQQNYDELAVLLDRFQGLGIMPDKDTAVALQTHLHTLKKDGQQSVSKAVTDRLAAITNAWHLSPQEDTFAVLRAEISTLAKAGQFQQAAAMLMTVQRNGVRPPVSLYAVIFHALVQQRRFKYARELYSHMLTLPGARNRKTFTSLFALLKGSGPDLDRKVEQLLQTCTSIKEQPDTMLFTAAAVRLFREGRFHAAIRVLRMAVAASTGLVLDLVACLVLAQCYAKLKDITGLIWCLEEMKTNKCLLDAQARKRVRKMIGEVYAEGAYPDKEGIRHARKTAASLLKKGDAPNEAGSKMIKALKQDS